MTKLIIYITKIIIATLIALLFSSCQYKIDIGPGIDGDGNVLTENRTVVGSFTQIDASEAIEVEVTQSDSKSIVVEADKNIIKHIITRIEDDILIIELDVDVDDFTIMKVKVSLPEITSLTVSSGSEILGMNAIKSSRLELRTSSAGEIEIDIEAEKVVCKSSSGSQITIRGKAIDMESISSSGSEINAKELLVNNVVAKASSGSSIDVNPLVSLEAKASSGSDINYVKEPKNISKKESSGGSVRKD